jgi:hypothetical protein
MRTLLLLLHASKLLAFIEHKYVTGGTQAGKALHELFS